MAILVSGKGNITMGPRPIVMSIPSFITTGLVLNLDASNLASYPGTGIVWTDLSGNINTGTLTNGPTYLGSPVGNIVFDGVNDYIDCGNGASIKIFNGSYSFWFKPTLVSTSGVHGINSSIVTGVIYGRGPNAFTIVTMRNGTFLGYGGSYQTTPDYVYNGTDFYYIFQNDTLGNTGFSINGMPSVGFTNNVWQNMTVVIQTASPRAIKWYINGVLSSSGNMLNAPSFTYTGNLNLGTTNFGINPFNGDMAKIRVYNTLLTDANVLQNYNAEKSQFGL